MCKGLCLSLCAAVAVAVLTMSVVGHAQSYVIRRPASELTVEPPPPGPVPPPSAIVSAWHAKFTKGWIPPRTPWGDPDLQGNFTSIDELKTPMERPAEFEGRTLDSITEAEMAARNKKIRADSANKVGGLTTANAPSGWYEADYQVNSRAWSVLDPPDGKIPPLTAAGRERQGRGVKLGSESEVGINPSTYLDWALGDRCIVQGAPPNQMMPHAHGNAVQVLQAPDYVTIRYEEVHETRIVPIKGRGADRPLLSYKLRPYFGDASAWFDGNTLVIDTVYHAKDNQVNGAPPETTRTIERFTRRTAPAGIEYTATIINPDHWVRPWTFQQLMKEDNRTGVVFEYPCHETNYSMVNSLTGTRAMERDEAEKTTKEPGGAR